MIKVKENISLQPLNTFGIQATARYFCEVATLDQLNEVLGHPIYKSHAHLILGGGSNILFTKDFDGIIIKSALLGYAVTGQTAEHIMLEAGSGENWHDLVMHCLANDWGGIENLSLIPGTVGAAPIQNIGAYGVEIKNVIEKVTAIDLTTGDRRTFTNSECRFGYRESVFKHDLKENIFISSITLRLTRKMHVLNTHYGAIQEVLKQRNIDHPSIQDISDAVVSIRRSKLPDPKVTGNAGSFFKNPTLSEEAFKKIKMAYPLIPS
jgi:UDP-N-acetylmuramate dehydrogenase